MKKFVLYAASLAFILLMLMTGCATRPTENIEDKQFIAYEEAFPSHYKKGLERAEKIELILTQEKGCTPNEAHFATSIIFPELTRYKALRGTLEIWAAKALKKNYSIGQMQMKNSFAVEIERQIEIITQNGKKLSEKYPDIAFAGNEANARDRKARIKRISNIKTQCDYLLAFIDVFSSIEGYDKYEDIKNEPPQFATAKLKQFATAKLLQFATAYNAGFQRSKQELERFSQSNGFPYGGLSVKSHWNYSAIAEGYFQSK